MTSSSKPSIFTARDTLHKIPAEPPRPPAATTARAPCTSSPFGKPSPRPPPTALGALAEPSSRARVSAGREASTIGALPAGVEGDDDTPDQQHRDGRRHQLAAPSTWASSSPAPGEAGTRDEAADGAGRTSKSASAATRKALAKTPPPEFAPPPPAPPAPPAPPPPPPPPPATPSTPIPADRGTARKRSASTLSGDAPSSEAASKRTRLRPRTGHFLDSFSIDPPPFDSVQTPPSPLFFSNSPRPRPSLPPRFSSSEAAAKMLSKARNEDSHVKTVSLARGLVTTPNTAPPTSTPQPQHASGTASIERSVSARSVSPDSSSGARDSSSMLNSVGIIELLEQDERPTFIVDLGNSSNYGPGPLNPLFCNSALRSYPGLEALVSGTPSDRLSPGPQTHLQFKSWLLSASVNGESLTVCLPSFLYAGMSWSCSTLRKKLRIISGAFLATPRANRPARPIQQDATPPLLTATTAGTSIATAAAVASGNDEPPDYFGSATAPPRLHVRSGANGETSSDAVADVVPTIEPIPPAGSEPLPTQTTYGSDDISLPVDRDLHAAVDLMPYPNTRISIVAPEAPSFDWTRLPVTDSMPKHIQFARSIDWAATSLGPIETWSSDLRQMCNLVMASPHPAAMYWGDDLVAIYNEAYVLLAGQKHPSLMGRSYRDAWAEIWDEVKDVFADARTTGEATMKDDDCLFIKRNNYLEETYFSWSIIPMVGRDGSVMGLYNPAFEKTRRKIAERRMLTLREVGERTASARDVKGFWAQVLKSFEFNEHDSPFLLLYSVADESDSDSSSVHSSSILSTRQCFLEGALGVPHGHPAAADQIDLRTGTEGFGPVFRDVSKTDRPVLLEVGSRELPETLVEDLEWRGFGDPVRAVVVCPIHPTTGESILGFLVLGINPRRPYDDDYSLFVQLLSRQLATSLASVVLFEEEIRRGQKAAKLAALDRIELSEQLAARTQEAIDSETRFTRMAEFAPVGIFIAGSDGRIIFANDTWYDISRVPRNGAMADTWMESVKPEDFDLVKQLWNDLVVETKPVSSELRFKAQWEDRTGSRGDTWVLFSAYPEKYENGRLKSVFGSITNISEQKWAEGIQTRKMEEAVELKRQQENFIDITSHEMRNPLSAMLQCCDEISSGLLRFKQSGEKEISDELVASCLDAAQIIQLCSLHQKRIVDDILTLSKLDSQLLLVTPVDAQPLTVVQRALKMHEGELQAADIQMKFVVDHSYRDLDLDWVRLDPSRVLQVLINLTTNAIKFTGLETKRTITVTIGASKKRPSELENAPVKYFPIRSKRKEVLQESEWGDGEKVFIHFSVKDTGRGLSSEEMKLLFMRFSQASPRTHVQYGGSGLGLFISRELTELQGGQIGVESETGAGSTFAFYIVSRRSSAPQNPSEMSGSKRAIESDAGGRSAPSALPKISTPQTIHSRTRAVTRAATRTGAEDSATSKQQVDEGSSAALPKRVLIIEDNLVNQRVLRKQLKNIGTEVHLANHGGEALEKLRQSTYWDPADGGATGPPEGEQRLELGVLLMDQEMPVMDGLTCTRKIRELEKGGKLVGHVPIIAVTANARAEQVQTALDAGMDDVVSKPFRLPELVPKIEELLAKFPAPAQMEAAGA